MSIDGALKLLADPREGVGAPDDTDASPISDPKSEIGPGAVVTPAEVEIRDPRKCASCGATLERVDPDYGPCFSCRSVDTGQSKAEALRRMRETGAHSAAFPGDDEPPEEFREAVVEAEPEPTLEELGQTLEGDLEHARRERDRLEDEIESLRTGDLQAEITKLYDERMRLRALLEQRTTEAQEAEKQARYYARVLKEVRALLGVDKTARVVPLLKQLLA